METMNFSILSHAILVFIVNMFLVPYIVFFGLTLFTSIPTTLTSYWGVWIVYAAVGGLFNLNYPALPKLPEE
jgi:hypothetical protein